MRNLTKRRAEVEADSSDLIATPTRTTTGISRGMVFTCSSYPASESDDRIDTPRPHETMDRIAASSEAVTWMRFASGGSSFSEYCS